MKKSTQRTLVTIVCAVLVCVLLIGVISYIGKRTNGFKEEITVEAMKQKLRNEKNLFDVADYTIDEVTNPGTGVAIKTAKDGHMTINGKLLTENAYVVEVGTVSLAKGTYKFTTGWNTGLYTANLKLVIDETTYYADFGEAIELDAAAEGTVYLTIQPDVQFDNVELYPVINAGTEAVSFYK